MQVEIPTGLQVLTRAKTGDGQYDEVVDVHVASPYGVSSHLLVPVAKAGAGLPGSATALAWKPNARITLDATVTYTTKTEAISADTDAFFSVTPKELVFTYPRLAVIPNSAEDSIQLFVRHGRVNIGAFDLPDLAFDERSSEYYIAGTHLQTLVGDDSNRLRLSVKRYLEHLYKNDTSPNDQTLILTVEGLFNAGGTRRPVPIQNSFQVQVDVVGRIDNSP